MPQLRRIQVRNGKTSTLEGNQIYSFVRNDMTRVTSIAVAEPVTYAAGNGATRVCSLLPIAGVTTKTLASLLRGRVGHFFCASVDYSRKEKLFLVLF